MELKDFITEMTGLTLSSMNKTNIGFKDSYIKTCELEIPENFNTIVMKLCPEIKDIGITGYKIYNKYDDTTFKSIPSFLVGINLIFDNNQNLKGGSTHYEKIINDYFELTYGGDMGFVNFIVDSLFIPPPKSNVEKFFEFFKKK